MAGAEDDFVPPLVQTAAGAIADVLQDLQQRLAAGRADPLARARPPGRALTSTLTA